MYLFDQSVILSSPLRRGCKNGAQCKSGALPSFLPSWIIYEDCIICKESGILRWSILAQSKVLSVQYTYFGEGVFPSSFLPNWRLQGTPNATTPFIRICHGSWWSYEEKRKVGSIEWCRIGIEMKKSCVAEKIYSQCSVNVRVAAVLPCSSRRWMLQVKQGVPYDESQAEALCEYKMSWKALMKLKLWY